MTLPLYKIDMTIVGGKFIVIYPIWALTQKVLSDHCSSEKNWNVNCQTGNFGCLGSSER